VAEIQLNLLSYCNCCWINMAMVLP